MVQCPRIATGMVHPSCLGKISTLGGGSEAGDFLTAAHRDSRKENEKFEAMLGGT